MSQKPHPVRHVWRPLPDFPGRDDLRFCAREECDMLRREYGGARYEYRTGASGGPSKFVANQKRSWPAPECKGGALPEKAQ